MGSSYKAVAIANELFNELTKRLPVLAPFSSQSFDTNGNPTIVIASTSSPATTQKNIFVQIAPESTINLTSIGTTPDVFVPTVINFATEAPAGGAGHMSDYLSPSDLANFFVAVFGRGTRVAWYQSANTVVPVVGTIIASNLQVSVDASLYWGRLASQ